MGFEVLATRNSRPVASLNERFAPPEGQGRCVGSLSPQGLLPGCLAIALLLTALRIVQTADEATASGQARSTEAEQKIKAACLYRFLQFMRWPEKTFVDRQSPFVIAILGEDPFSEAVEAAVKDKTVSGRPVIVKRFRTLKEVGACHLAFVSATLKEPMARVLETLKPFSAVAVGESPELVKEGGNIRFFVAEGRVQFEINKPSLKLLGVEASAQLLRLSR